MDEKKNFLVAQIHGLGTMARGVMLETLQNLIDDNPDANIYYLTCSNTFNVCYINTFKKPEICYLCKKGIEKGLEMIHGNFIHLEIEDLLEKEDVSVAEDFSKANPIITRDVKYSGYEVGEAAISSYISKTRDKDLTKIENSFANGLVENDVMLYRALDRLFNKISFYKVYNFNGRNSYQRAVLNISRKHKIECINLEISRPGGFLDIFPNELPHHIKSYVSLVENTWDASPLKLSEKNEIGSSFYQKKVEGVRLNDVVYIQDQERNRLPDGIDFTKKTLVLFTSSDDEFAAVGIDFVNPFFKDQNEGIAYVAKLVATKFKDYNLIIRMHPNLKGVDYEYVDELKNMGQVGDNVTVLPPESPVDSYALLNVAEKVIVFGSTIGLEANFWEKPVILLGKCFWYFHDVAYVPNDKEDIEGLLRQDLNPKSKADAIKFGFYYMEGGKESRYYNGKHYNGKEITDFNLYERLKARLIMQAHRTLGVRLFVR